VSLVLNQSIQSGAKPYYYYGYDSKGGSGEASTGTAGG